MISDIFYTRYQNPIIYGGSVPQEIHVLFRQAAHIVFEDICNHHRIPSDIFTTAHRKLAREIGLVVLAQANNDLEVCTLLLLEQYDLWKNRHGDGDYFIKIRLSLIELLFREIEAFAEQTRVTTKKRFFSSVDEEASSLLDTVNTAISELNSRFRIGGLPFHYHNGFIQFSNDTLVEQQLEEPFWRILKDKKWKNVDIDIKEALHRRDTRGRDATLYAFKALESTIKIISDEKGYTSGHEKGAANFIDNLNSKANGRFIDVWEAKVLKNLFAELRNPHGHGPGTEEMPQLSPTQETFVIESVMVWVKSLISRM